MKYNRNAGLKLDRVSNRPRRFFKRQGKLAELKNGSHFAQSSNPARPSF